MPILRVFDRVARQMQRLGYLKRLIKRVNSTATSNLDNIGNDLVDISLRKIRVPLNDERANYIRFRLSDRAYETLKSQTIKWLKNSEQQMDVQMELQDLYLADSSLPSQVGKLVKEDWRRYPGLGLNLGLIREGTYSINTRSLSLLHFIHDQELQAFQEYLPNYNPFRISLNQGLLFLYSLIENDGEAFIPLYIALSKLDVESFNDRDAGNLLPEIYKTIIARYRSRSLTIDMRERLDGLEKSAESITALRSKERYSGGGSREEASRPRLEPYADIGFFVKPQKMKYEFAFSDVGRRWAAAFDGNEDSVAIEEFLARRFFHVAADAWKVQARELTSPDEIVPYLQRAAKIISSSGGYAPIEELALVSGIWALTEDHAILEPGVAREAIIAFQKANPYRVRFTVDRSGTLAHARFLDEQPGS